MCIARLVMQEWWDHFKVILESSNLKEFLRAIYVDDGRMMLEKLKLGVRFVKENSRFEFDEKWLVEDELEGKTREDNTQMEVCKAMNSVSEDLKFTIETVSDFPKGRLPTLAFEIWLEKSGIRHSYFEKDMRSQIMTMKRSSQSEQSKFSILVNKLSRRFEVLDSQIEMSEKVEIIDHFTQQLKNSGYSNDQIREIIISGLKGVIRKEERKLNESKRYRSSADTLIERERKKLTESTNWYREKKKDSDEDNSEKERNKEKWSTMKTRNIGKRKDRKSIEIYGKLKTMSVIFVPHTQKSELAKRWREKLENFERISSVKLKVVERTGIKVVDLLHKSDVWSDQDCKREDCLICSSCVDKERRGLCKRRNVVYETFCLTCHYKKKAESEKIELERNIVENGEVKKRKKVNLESPKTDENEKNKEKKEENKRKRGEIKSVEKKVEKVKRDFLVKYVGETGRSGYERAKEHVSDFKNLVDTSHLLKHYILHHQNEMKLEEMQYGMRIRKSYNTAIERQVAEAVSISFEKKNGKILLNSKAEYNRCTLPRISTKSKKETDREKEIDDAEEKIFEEKMKILRKEKRTRKLEKLKEKEDSQPTLKKLKKICIEIGNENIEKWQKRRKEQEKERKEQEAKEEKEIMKYNRVKEGERKKKDLISNLKKRGKLKLERKSEDWIKERKSFWRNFREKESVDNILEEAENPQRKSAVEEKKVKENGQKSDFQGKEGQFEKKSGLFLKKLDLLKKMGYRGKFKFTFKKSVLSLSDPPGELSVNQGGVDPNSGLNLDTLFSENNPILSNPPTPSADPSFENSSEHTLDGSFNLDILFCEKYPDIQTEIASPMVENKAILDENKASNLTIKVLKKDVSKLKENKTNLPKTPPPAKKVNKKVNNDKKRNPRST